MAEQFANGGTSTLSAAITSTATSLTVASAAGFSSSATFRLQLTSATSGNTNVEIVEVTAVSGATFTVTRAAEPYNGVQTAYAWNAGDFVAQVLTASGLAAAAPTIPSYDTTVLTKLSLAPVAYWKLNEPSGSTTAADSSGNGYTLTASGTVTFGEPSVVPSDSETSVQGDGTTGYLATSGTPALLPTGASPVSVIAAINMPTASPERSVASWGTATANNLWQFEGYNYAFFFGDFGTGLQASMPVAHQPTLVGFSYDGATFLGFANGQVGVRQSNFTMAVIAGPMYILALNDAGATRFSNFPIGRVAVFAGVLTPKDWRLLMQAFTGV